MSANSPISPRPQSATESSSDSDESLPDSTLLNLSKEWVLPSSSASWGFDSVWYNHLNKLGLLSYSDTLRKTGVISIETAALLREADLVEVGVPPVTRRVILEKIHGAPDLLSFPKTTPDNPSKIRSDCASSGPSVSLPLPTPASTLARILPAIEPFSRKENPEIFFRRLRLLGRTIGLEGEELRKMAEYGVRDDELLRLLFADLPSEIRMFL